MLPANNHTFQEHVIQSVTHSPTGAEIEEPWSLQLVGSGHVCGQTITVYFQRDETLGITTHCGNGNQAPCLPCKGQEDKDPAFVNSGSSLAVEECACENTVYSDPSQNLQIETNNSGDICNYGKRVFTEWEKTD